MHQPGLRRQEKVATDFFFLHLPSGVLRYFFFIIIFPRRRRCVRLCQDKDDQEQIGEKPKDSVYSVPVSFFYTHQILYCCCSSPEVILLNKTIWYVLSLSLFLLSREGFDCRPFFSVVDFLRMLMFVYTSINVQYCFPLLLGIFSW